MQGEIGSGIQPVHFVFLHLRQVLFTLLHHNVASGAGVVASTGMLQMNAAIQGDIQQRFRQAMVFIRQLPGFELHRFAFGKKSYFGHTSSIAGRHLLWNNISTTSRT